MNKPSKKRQQVIEAAAKLFARDGIQSTGIDDILAEAEVAKRTLYNHFPSKDELVVAVLEYIQGNWHEWFDTAIRDTSDDPIERLYRIITVVENWLDTEDYAGGAFLRTALEHADPEDPIYAEIRSQDQRMRDTLTALAKEADLAEPDQFADQIALLISGAMVETIMIGKKRVIPHLSPIAKAVIDQLIQK